MGETGHAVDDQEHVVALIAKMLGDGDGRKRRHLAQHRALVAGRNDGHRFLHMRAERILDEFAHFAATFADKGDHHLVEGVGSRHHRQQRRFANAGAGEDAEALTKAERREDIDSAHAGLETGFDALARHRRRCGVGDRACLQAGSHRPKPVDRLAERIDRAATPAVIGRKAKGTLADDSVLDADRFARLDRTYIGELRLDADDLAEVNAGLRAMRNEIAEAHLSGKAGDGIVPSSDGAYMAAMGHGILRHRVLARQNGQMRKLRRHCALRQPILYHDKPLYWLPPRVLMASVSVPSLLLVKVLILSKARLTSIRLAISRMPLTLEFSI